MKSILALAVLTASFFTQTAAWAALPPARIILQRMTDNAGNGSYVIEQEVQIPTGAEPLSLKETWIVESDRTMRVTVTPMRDPKDSVRLQILYAGGQRWVLRGGSRASDGVPTEFAERPFHLRSFDSAASLFTNLKILPLRALDKRPLPRKSEDIKREPETFVRLGRTGGVIAWAFGETSSGADANPGLWIEQDQFVVRKLRFASGSEITADAFSSYSRGLSFPKQRIIRWGANVVPLRVLSVSSRSGTGLSMTSLDVPWKIQGLEAPTQALVEEFYTRFR